MVEMELLVPQNIMGNRQFWFESFQNWQSEFLSIAVLALLRGLSPAKRFARVQTGRNTAFRQQIAPFNTGLLNPY